MQHIIFQPFDRSSESKTRGAEKGDVVNVVCVRVQPNYAGDHPMPGPSQVRPSITSAAR